MTKSLMLLLIVVLRIYLTVTAVSKCSMVLHQSHTENAPDAILPREAIRILRVNEKLQEKI